MIQNKFNDIRHKYKMNQRQFAEYIGINESLYSNWEHQKRQPSLEKTLKISVILKCTVNDLFDISE